MLRAHFVGNVFKFIKSLKRETQKKCETRENSKFAIINLIIVSQINSIDNQWNFQIKHRIVDSDGSLQ